MRSEAGGKLEWNAATGSLAIGFSMAEAGRVSLRAFDSQGRLLAVLLDADQAAGDHALSLFSHRLQAMHGSIVFALSWGGASMTRTFALP
jgi:hypothetical protein